MNIPLFEPGETRYRDSIEGGYASMARFYSRHPNIWGWNPTQYGGLPAQFTYLPGLPYLSGLLSRAAPAAEPYYVYRLAASTAACLVPSAFFFFVLAFTGSRGWAVGAALAYTVFSPAYGLIRTIDKDRGAALLPWRLQVLVKYGEGPHNAGLMLMPLALTALGRGRVVAGAILLAAVALTNWVAALATAFCCLMLMLAFAGSSGFRSGRVLASGALGYGLACFWLTPSFISTIAFNWPADAFNYQLQHQQEWLLGGLAACLLLIRLLFHFFWREHRYACFTTLCFFGFAWCVVWFYSYGLNAIPESRRYAVEFEFFLFAALFEFFRRMWGSASASHRFAVGFTVFFLIIAGYSQAWRFLTQGFRDRHPMPKEQMIEHRLAQRVSDLYPHGRVFASGGLRFRLNSWFDFHQVGGGFESGLTSRQALYLFYWTRAGWEPLAALKALGVEYLVVHGPKSREHYRDIRNPARLDELLEAVHREEDDVIYRVPFTSLAHLVTDGDLSSGLAGYVAALEDLSRPRLSARWADASTLEIGGPVPDGMLVSVQVRADKGWTARQDGRALAVEPDYLGWVILRPEPSASTRLVLEYRGTTEQRVFAGLSAGVWLAMLAFGARRRILRSS